MNFDLITIPFSRYGSYIAFSHLPATANRIEGLYLRHVHGPGDLNPDTFQEVMRIEPVQNGQPVGFTEIASPTMLRLETDNGYAEFCLPEPNVVRVQGHGVGLRLTLQPAGYDYAIPRKGQRWHISRSGADEVNYMITPLQGTLAVTAPWNRLRSEQIIIDLLPANNIIEAALEEFITVWEERDYPDSFEISLQQVAQEYIAWQETIPQVPEKYAAITQEAAYINWSCVVASIGHLTRPAMFMSKHKMAGIWSWDNCFNAIALAEKNFQLAWDQLMIMFDNQDKYGQLPDLLNDRLGLWSFTKPPIQGWTLRQLMDRTDYITPARLAELYQPLCRWTDWWFKYRDDDDDGVPQYNHGNDSGWDNSTVFTARPPIESPDLCAYLIIQMETLAYIARTLSKNNQAQQWQTRATNLLSKMMEHFWRDDQFVALSSGSHELIETESLQMFIPIILGKRLPDNVRKRLIASLKAPNRFLTKHGLATESISSPLYEPNGYWRGPIWGGPMALIGDGLIACGEVEFAHDLYRRFCDMVAQNGIAENYNALTGAGLCERGFSWTASLFLTLAHELLREDQRVE